MSFRFILGRSGSGKSRYVFEYAIKEAKKDLNKRYLIVVPDQFTMQTQSDIVKMSPNGGIMNIEVLSFSRLAYRVFEETGGNRYPVLDDTGKNLILRKCAADVKDRIPYLGGKLDRPGYIHEVKSAISEFMQYDIDKNGLNELIEYSGKNNRRNLTGKLKDLAVIYESFTDYIKDKYITTEESMDILASEIYKSKVVADSVVILDGFTGFTPIQNRVLSALMNVCDKVIMTLTIDPSLLSTSVVNEQNLFSFTWKTYQTVMRLTTENECQVEEAILLKEVMRYADDSDLKHMEKAIYNYPLRQSDTFKGDISITSCENIRDEVRNLASNIRRLTRDGSVCYRDIAVITGNLSAYSSDITEKFEDMEIPFYIDETKELDLNPFVEYIRAVIELYNSNFSVEAVFQYLGTGFTGLSFEEAGKLKNYVTECGIKGYRAYSTVFSKKTRQMKKLDRNASNQQSEDENVNSSLQMLEEINAIRVRLMDELKALTDGEYYSKKKQFASAFVISLYNFLTDNRASEKLKAYEEFFGEKGDFSRKKEYSQVYNKTMHMLEQVYNLVGDEEMTLDDFYGILDAGFDEIEIGMIPQSVDRVIVGDMERTRLNSVKYLFFLGLNDGWVPKPGGKGGIISDADREFLADSGQEMAPSPRKQMYIGRFYLYSNITKPSDGLYLSYTAMDGEASAMRPSYVVDMLKKIFPQVTVEDYRSQVALPETMKEARELYAVLIRKYAESGMDDNEKQLLFALTDILKGRPDFLETMINNAFFRYKDSSLDSVISAILYGTRLSESISKFEKFAQCAYSYFLKYGMELEDSEEYGVDAADMGNIYHGVLSIFNSLMTERGTDWFNITEEEIEELVNEAVNQEAVEYTDSILFDSSKNRYIISRMCEVMKRTISTLIYQLKKGEFVPMAYEMKFYNQYDLDGEGGAESIALRGMIDRVDVCEKDDSIYVKIIDYKSGNKSFSLLNFYHGIQLQLVVYMNEAIRKIKSDRKDMEVMPAAILYYHIDDPTVEPGESASPSEIEQGIIDKLKTKGLVNADESIIDSLHGGLTGKSDVIPVGYKKDGTFYSSSSVVDADDMKMLGEYAEYKIKELAGEMAGGDISVRPLKLAEGSNDSVDSCKYCSYKGICGFDEHMPGYEYKNFKKKEDAEVLSEIRKILTGGVDNA